MMNEVYSGIYMITEKGAFGLLKPPVNIYIVTGTNGIVFDGGYGNRRAFSKFVRRYRAIMKQCAGEGRECHVSRVLLSHGHPDHFGGLKLMREKLGLKIMVTRRSAPLLSSRSHYRASYRTDDIWWYMSFPSRWKRIVVRILRHPVNRLYEFFYGTSFIENPDIIIDEEGTVQVNGEPWRVIYVPGHSDDHIALYDPCRGILFAGDNIMRSMSTWLGPPKSDLDAYVKSLERMRDLPGIRIVLSAHGSPITNPVERIQELIDVRNLRTEQVMSIVAESGEAGTTLQCILRQLYPGEGWLKHRAAEGWVQTTLQYLISMNRISMNMKDGKTFFMRI